MESNGREKTVLLVGHNRDTLKRLRDHVQRMNYFDDYELAFSGKEAVRRAKEYRPALIICSLIMPDMDGLSLLEHIRKEPVLSGVKVIVYANTGTEYLMKMAFKYGADYYLITPIRFSVFQKRVRDLMEMDQEDAPFAGGQIENAGLEDTYSVYRLTTHILQKIGVSANAKGYYCIRKCIEMLYDNESYLKALTTKLYPEVAKALDTSGACVERNIRHAVEVAWSTGNLEYIDSLFGYTIDANRGKPTNAAFLATILDHIKTELNKVD